MIHAIKSEIRRHSDKERAKIVARFFKTGKGEYGEGDIFLGIIVPESRKIAVMYKSLPLSDVRILLKSKAHEERLIALFILVQNFQKGSEPDKKQIFKYYLKNIKHVNNWDLVDSSADKIIGEYLYFQQGKLIGTPKILQTLTRSKNLWERRIAMISTFAFIKRGECSITFDIAEKLIHDKHDLIQKAVGWMLREAGKRCGQRIEEEFLSRNYKRMGRTCLRYSIEHFPPQKRLAFLKNMV